MAKGAIFDMDGVLIDSFYAWAKTVDMAAKNFGYGGVTIEEFKPCFGQSTEKDIENFMDDVSVGELERFYNDAFPEFLDKTRLIAGAKELLDELKKRGVKIALATNTNRFIAEKQLEVVGIKDYFDVIVCGDDVSKAKPDPMILEKTVSDLGLSKDDCIYVGDTLTDVETGKNAGVFTIGFKINADVFVDELIDVVEYIEEKC